MKGPGALDVPPPGRWLGLSRSDSCVPVAGLHVPEHPLHPRHCSQAIPAIFHFHSHNDMSLLPHIWAAHTELGDFISAAHTENGIN